jgi:hypothetical protein
LFASGFEDNEIILCGNSKSAPVHIYCRTFFDGRWLALDLTEDYFDEERHYNFYQAIQIYPI